jgi:hypothetical protein
MLVLALQNFARVVSLSLLNKPRFRYLRSSSAYLSVIQFRDNCILNRYKMYLQLTLVISNSMGPWKTFESTVVRLMRSYEDTGSVVEFEITRVNCRYILYLFKMQLSLNWITDKYASKTPQPNELKLGRNHLWRVLYKDCSFRPI